MLIFCKNKVYTTLNVTNFYWANLNTQGPQAVMVRCGGRAECKKSMQTQIIWDIKEPQEKRKYVQGGRIDFPKVIYLIGASLNALGGTFEIYFNRPNGKF